MRPTFARVWKANIFLVSEIWLISELPVGCRVKQCDIFQLNEAASNINILHFERKKESECILELL